MESESKWPIAVKLLRAVVPALLGALMGVLLGGSLPEVPLVVALRAAVRPILCGSSSNSLPVTLPPVLHP